MRVKWRSCVRGTTRLCLERLYITRAVITPQLILASVMVEGARCADILWVVCNANLMQTPTNATPPTKAEKAIVAELLEDDDLQVFAARGSGSLFQTRHVAKANGSRIQMLSSFFSLWLMRSSAKGCALCICIILACISPSKIAFIRPAR